MAGDQSAPVTSPGTPGEGDLEREKLALEREKLILGKDQLQLDQQRFAVERRRNLTPWLAALAAATTVITGFLTYLGTEDARQRERFESLVQALTSRDDKVDPARRVGAASALPAYYSMTSWRRYRDYPFRYEVVNLIAVSYKLRSAEAGLAGAAEASRGPIPKLLEGVKPESRTDYVFYQTLAEAVKTIGASDPSAFTAVNVHEGCLNNLGFSGAKLHGVVLTLAHLSADFSGADLSQARLNGADLTDADLRDADLRDAHLGWYLMDRLVGATILRDADLTHVDLTRASLYGAQLQDANLSDASLAGADLNGASLTRARLIRADLTGADLSWYTAGNYIAPTYLDGADLAGADLTGANLLYVEGLETATFTRETVLPDGTKWKPGTDLSRFTRPEPDGK